VDVVVDLAYGRQPDRRTRRRAKPGPRPDRRRHARRCGGLLAVGLLLSGGSGNKVLQAGLSILAVAAAWASVHTVFTTRYARLYYTGPDGGIDFNQDDPPQYSDFAYLAFTIGLTFQVSDTDLKTKLIRATAAAAHAAVLPVRRRHHRHHHQPRLRPRQIASHRSLRRPAATVRRIGPFRASPGV